MKLDSVGAILAAKKLLLRKGLLSSDTADAGRIKQAFYLALGDEQLTADEVASINDSETPREAPANSKKEGSRMVTKATPERVFGGGSIRVKSPSEAYSTKRPAATHRKLGRVVFDESGEEVSRPSQMSLAKSGAFLKFTARRAGLQVDWTEHDAQLFKEVVEKDEWASFQGEAHENRIYAAGAVKTLLDESGGSGGLEVVPIEFDSDVITFPLLQNELLPLVDLKPVARGRRIEGASMLSPSVSWGGGDGNEGTLFNTASMVAALDTTIFTVDCFVEVGRDFLSDSPVNVGALLTQLIGERLGSELDRVIADGNGSSEPQGIMQASSTTSVSFGGSAVTTAKLLQLLFGVGKQYRAGNQSFAFCSNETSYMRARAVNTGVTGDTRFALGMDVESYRVLERPWKIATVLTNAEHFAGAMNRYRMYRRLGMSVEWSTQGKDLMRHNTALLCVRARYGGRVMDPSAFAVVTNAEN